MARVLVFLLFDYILVIGLFGVFMFALDLLGFLCGFELSIVGFAIVLELGCLVVVGIDFVFLVCV